MAREEVEMDSVGVAGKGGKSDHPSVIYGSTGNLPWAVGFRGGCRFHASSSSPFFLMWLLFLLL